MFDILRFKIASNKIRAKPLIVVLALDLMGIIVRKDALKGFKCAEKPFNALGGYQPVIAKGKTGSHVLLG